MSETLTEQVSSLPHIEIDATTYERVFLLEKMDPKFIESHDIHIIFDPDRFDHYTNCSYSRDNDAHIAILSHKNIRITMLYSSSDNTYVVDTFYTLLENNIKYVVIDKITGEIPYLYNDKWGMKLLHYGFSECGYVVCNDEFIEWRKNQSDEIERICQIISREDDSIGKSDEIKLFKKYHIDPHRYLNLFYWDMISFTDIFDVDVEYFFKYGREFKCSDLTLEQIKTPEEYIIKVDYIYKYSYVIEILDESPGKYTNSITFIIHKK